jgi:hypothetical protein
MWQPWRRVAYQDKAGKAEIELGAGFQWIRASYCVKDQSGIVAVQASMYKPSGAGIAMGELVGRLPAGCRPASIFYYTAYTFNFANSLPCWLAVDTNGEMRCHNNAGAYHYIYLSFSFCAA